MCFIFIDIYGRGGGVGRGLGVGATLGVGEGLAVTVGVGDGEQPPGQSDGVGVTPGVIVGVAPINIYENKTHCTTPTSSREHGKKFRVRIL